MKAHLPNLPRIAERLFGTPLMIEPRKMEVIVEAIGPRLSGEAAPANITPPEQPAYAVSDGVAVIPVMGSLVHRGDWLDAMSGLTSYDSLRQNLSAALLDESVQAILLEIDSPGGEVSGNFDFADMVYAARQVKPVWAIANDLAASAAYSIGSAAEKLFVTQTGIVGSIGVIMAHRDNSAANDKAGVKYTSIYAGARKNDLSPNAALTEEAHASAQARVNDVYDVFVAKVARNRGISEAAVRATEAGVFTGQKAVDLGLADEVSTVSEVFRRLAEHAAHPQSTTSTQQQQEHITMTTEPTPTKDNPPALDEKAIAQQAREAERTRASSIISAAVKLNVPAEEAQKLINQDLSVEAAKDKLIDFASANSETVGIRAAAPNSKSDEVDPDAPIEERAQAEWDSKAAIRKEFAGNFEDYKAFRAAQEKGLVRIHAPTLVVA
jgi:signal peptide peptidase SppA